MLIGGTLPVRLDISPQRLHLPTGLRHDGWLTTTVQLKDSTAATAHAPSSGRSIVI